jgi:hypothetical protein
LLFEYILEIRPAFVVSRLDDEEKIEEVLKSVQTQTCLVNHPSREAKMPILRVSPDDTELCRDVRPFTPPLSPFDRLALNYNMSEGQQDPIESLTPEEANRIIHSHRKVRYGKPGAPHHRQISSRSLISPPYCTQRLIVQRDGMLAMQTEEGEVR